MLFEPQRHEVAKRRKVFLVLLSVFCNLIVQKSPERQKILLII
ncbi:MAG: hypothetical protein AVDCRST_MAG96-3280 [uncultured Segetibacter sp.]|uniref:Uncharacterized protein n=1 Tax=uncultured Segetibacter sp. TaxID=481133 RepID=A0A6J4TM17_9BACT|nr:MAG: hypothetical protein AVDCRST_MAG96-3280 [uncultured Segetibacter sp.]